MPPHVTLGMPVYNSEPAYFEATLNGLLAQTYSDFEIILSDNASSESARALYEDAARRDTRIRYVRHPVNTGALSNFQYVLAQARGRLFAWVADDDLRAPTFLEIGVSHLERDPALVAVQYHTKMIRLNGESIGTADIDDVHPAARSPRARLKSLHSRNTNLLIYGLHRREILQRLDLSPRSVFWDMIQTVDLLLHGRVATAAGDLFSYRIDLTKEDDHYRSFQHLGEGAESVGSTKYSDAAFLCLSRVLSSRAELSTGDRVSCFVGLSLLLFQQGWFSRDEFYRSLGSLKRGLGQKEYSRAAVLAAKCVVLSPSYPFRRWRSRRVSG